MVFDLKINSHYDFDLLDDSERADIYCKYLTDVADVYTYLTQLETSFFHLVNFDRYCYDGFSITVNDNADIYLVDEIENIIDNILLENDVCFATLERYEEC